MFTRENGLLKSQLVEMGYEVPKTNYVLKLEDDQGLLNASRAGEAKQPGRNERSAVHETNHTPRKRHSGRSINHKGQCVCFQALEPTLQDTADGNACQISQANLMRQHLRAERGNTKKLPSKALRG